MSPWPAPSCMAPMSMRPTEPRASPVGVLDSGDEMIRCISSAASYAVSIMASSTPRTCCSDKRRMSLIMAAESPSRLTPRLAIDNLLVHHTPERVLDGVARVHDLVDPVGVLRQRRVQRRIRDRHKAVGP